mgnify:CR=1 FL=1
MGLFNLEKLNNLSDDESINLTESTETLQLYTEAVFKDGKKQLESLVPKVQAIKDTLEKEISEKKDEFAPKAFWRNNVWKDFENELCKIFGFKNAEVNPYIEKYRSKDDVFQSKELNAFVYNSQRYLIDGLVTDKGFYDSTKSMQLDVHISLGLIRTLTAEEIIAVLLHEFGHAIDPALVDIKYHSSNILSKYLTDREKEINNNEKNVMKDILSGGLLGGMIIILLPILLVSFMALSIVELGKSVSKAFNMLFNKKKFTKKMGDKYLKEITKVIDSDHTKFNKKYYAEAYADNFARMYGYGPDLISALKKLSKDFDKKLCDRYKNEINRQEIIADITKSLINDSHKTDIHRARALVIEYKKDIDDPNTPPIVKKQLEEDLKELEIIIDSYTKDFSNFQNKVNAKINKELEKLEKEAKNDPDIKDNEKSEDKKETDKKENKDSSNDKTDSKDEAITESNKAYEELMNNIKSTTKEERAKAKRIFGDVSCSLAKDKDGYYFATHRARTNSYERIEDIPKSQVKFVDSTC